MIEGILNCKDFLHSEDFSTYFAAQTQFIKRIAFVSVPLLCLHPSFK